MKKALIGYYLLMSMLFSLGLYTHPASAKYPPFKRSVRSAVIGALWPAVVPFALIGVMRMEPKP